MGKILLKLVITILLIIAVKIGLDSFATPINNNIAMLQLEDSNATYGAYTFLTKYKGVIELGISVLITVLVFFKEIRLAFKKNK